MSERTKNVENPSDKSVLGYPMSTRDHSWMKHLLDDARDYPRLTEWEEKFISDYWEKLERFGRHLMVSEKQLSVLEKIEVKIYSIK